MDTKTFSIEIDKRIAKYDLLCHPFYKSWTAGALSRNQIKDYACNYYHHVAAFPNYLDTLQKRLPDGELRATVLDNKADEEGFQSRDGRTHADIWMDFARGMGASFADVLDIQPIPEIQNLIDSYRNLAANSSPVEALAALYAYESQIPRVATEKERGLKEHYGADERTSYYFTLHKTFDVMHSRTWLELLAKEAGSSDQAQEAALTSAELAAKSLWTALDGIERDRLHKAGRNISDVTKH